ncbi:hypothetical protein SEPCBS57363_005485 [Sporothrix epigloea]|uniref:SWIM-type domain-containing protein n=1 Tax=Sporothrix epigloea TaxID=1892477 RepID=A0ABP0DXT6_9PEZI
MCLTTYYNHPVCGCQWLAIVKPCAPGRGFLNCPHLRILLAKKAPEGFLAKFSRLKAPFADAVTAQIDVLCPVHTLGGQYDRNLVRRIYKVRNGVRWGLGPQPKDVGIECGCSVM